MAYRYKHLNANDKARIDRRVPEPPEPAVDDELRRAWEADHYAHSLLAADPAFAHERQAHLDAMATIEAALTG